MLSVWWFYSQGKQNERLGLWVVICRRYFRHLVVKMRQLQLKLCCFWLFLTLYKMLVSYFPVSPCIGLGNLYYFGKSGALTSKSTRYFAHFTNFSTLQFTLQISWSTCMVLWPMDIFTKTKCVSSTCDYTDLFLQGPHLTPFKITLLIIGFKCTGIMILLSNALACLNQIA